MEKVQVTLTIRSEEETQESKLEGIYDSKKDRLVIEEKNPVPLEMTMDFKKQLLVRKTEDYCLKIPFLEKEETTSTIELTKEKQTLNLKIKTEKYTYHERRLDVKYKMIETEEKIEYQIKF